MTVRNAAVAAVSRRRHWREEDARVVVEAWRRSGQTLTAFAHAHGLQADRVGRWQRRLRAQNDETVRFHPVRLRPDEAPVTSSEKLEVVLRSGQCVRVPPQFDPGELRRLLNVLDAEA